MSQGKNTLMFLLKIIVRFTSIFLRIIFPALTVSIFFISIIYPIPWLWRNLWILLSIPLIILWLVIISIISIFLFRITPSVSDKSASFVKDVLVYLIVLITHSPILYSQIRPPWGAAMLSKRPITKRIYILENIEKTQAWNILLNIERKSNSEFIELLKNINRERLKEFLFLDSFSRRQIILKKLGLNLDLGDDMKPYISSHADKEDLAVGTVNQQFNKKQIRTDSESEIDTYSEEYQKEVITKDKLSQIPHDHVTMGLLGITNGINLFEAEVNNNYRNILDILRQNPELVHERDRFKGKTLLHHAVLLGALKVTENLLQMGADVNSKDEDGLTPLTIACAGINSKLIAAKLLISKGADVNYKIPIIPNSPKHGWTPIHLSARNGHTKIVDLLISNGSDINATKADGWTPLHVAVAFCHIEIVRLLLSKGANLNAIANDNFTVLMACAYMRGHIDEVRRGYAEIAKLLLEKGVDINEKDRNGQTVLMRAIEIENTPLVKVLEDWQEKTLFGKKKEPPTEQTEERIDRARMGEYSLLQLSSPVFRNTPSSSDDDQLVKQAYSLMQNVKWGEARKIIQDGLQTCKRKDRLCELIANIYLNEKNPVAIGWYMQSCVLGSPSWVPYLLVSYAACALGLDDIAWRCLNACDVLDTGMKRIDNLEKDITEVVKNANRSELLGAMKNFEKTMGTYLPSSDELPHNQMKRSTFLLQNITGDPEMQPIKQRLRLMKRR